MTMTKQQASSASGTDLSDKRTRLLTAFNLEQPDRPPIFGGWLAAPNYIQALTGCSEDEYWADKFYWGLEAERVLGSDGVIHIFEPIARGEFRCVDGQVLERRAAYSVDKVLAEIEAFPEPEELEANFDEAYAYAGFIADFKAKQQQCGDILWCPADWNLIPKALWYHEFGYEGALLTLGLYPERYLKLLKISAVWGRQRALLHARAIREGIQPPAILTGEDLCSQQGPMVSPAFLNKEYWPLVEYTLEPVIEAGGKIVWHCDGNYRPLLDNVLACGVAGLQGFQKECGMDLEWIVDLKTRRGDPLLIFGPMSVTRTLPYGSPDDVRAEFKWALDLCRDKAGLVIFTSNTLTPDIPLENIKTLWQMALESRW